MLYHEKQTPPATLCSSVSQTGRTGKKIDSPKYMNLPGRSFQKNANEKSFFRSSCCTVFKETNIISEVVLEIFGNLLERLQLWRTVKHVILTV